MCGIVGYVGNNDNAIDILIEGLSSLEYRGYDSAGISVVDSNKEIITFKAEGKLDNLKNIVQNNISSNIGIGHTRWATHGAPSDINAHPHFTERLSLVHNGIIENYKDIKKDLLEKGYKFISETDTEAAANLIDSLYDGDALSAIKKAVNIIEGSYAFAIIFKDDVNKVYAVRKSAPLIVALGDNENFLASDVPAILKYTNKYVLIEENNIAVLEKDKITIYDESLKETDYKILEANWTLEQAEKCGYEHFMLKEINEQPKALLDTIEPRIVYGVPDFERDGITDNDFWTFFDRVYIVGCGT
ncbi:glucosamine--fructose-6-phosphate aminotransferase [Brachyspira pilosicoli B2904]|nr:glucosamine--fructose-6-phosphate aminotransferase [Brachyspira pilosicoli B2904]